jgi:hypothetical protein
VLLGQLHRELDREMLGDYVRGGRKLLGPFMPISLGTLADVEHSRTSTSAGIAHPSQMAVAFTRSPACSAR